MCTHTLHGLSLLTALFPDQAHTDLDRNSDGTVSLEEYMAWFDLYDCRRQFQKYDLDQSGSINRREFGKIVMELGLPLTRRETDQLFNILSKKREKGNRSIDFKTFLAWWERIKANTKEAVLQVQAALGIQLELATANPDPLPPPLPSHALATFRWRKMATGRRRSSSTITTSPRSA